MNQIQNTTIKINIGLLIISIIIALLFYPGIKSTFNEGINLSLSIIVFSNTVIFFRSVLRIYSTWVRFDFFFLLGFIILHFQIPFFASIGIEPNRPEFIWINKNIVNYSTWLSTVCILGWMLGYSTKIINNQNASSLKIKTKKNIKYIESIWLDYFLLLLFLLFIIIVGSDFLSGSYNVNNWGTGATYVYLLLKVVIFLKTIYFYKNLKSKKNKLYNYIFQNKLYIIVTITYLVLFLLTGDRGPVLQITSIHLIGYSMYYKNIKLRTLILILIGGAIIFGLLRAGRTRDASERSGNIFHEGIQQYNDQISNPTDEFASSLRILYRAVDVVPEKHSYLNGTTLLSNLIDIIPFSSQIYQPPLMYQSSTLFFTILGQGQFFSYGEGSEIIADLYINIGPYLTIIVFFLMGYYIAHISINAHLLNKHSSIIIYFVLMTVAIYINRSTFLHPLKIIIYTLVLDAIFIKKKKYEPK